MDRAVTLSLERAWRIGPSYRFRVVLHNRSSARLLLVWPEGLRIVHSATGTPAEGWVWILEETAWPPTFVLGPGETWSRPVAVWPCDVLERRPWRWLRGDVGRCWDMPRGSGPYRVWYDYRIDADYFDPGSHCRFEHLVREAEQAGASVWTGHLRSNEVLIRR